MDEFDRLFGIYTLPNISRAVLRLATADLAGDFWSTLDCSMLPELK